jgi:hypothetical protein
MVCPDSEPAPAPVQIYCWRPDDNWTLRTFRRSDISPVRQRQISPAGSAERKNRHGARIALESHLATLRLKIHPIKSQLFKTRHGASFVGFRILPDRIRVRQGNLRRARRRLRQLREDWIVGKIRGFELNRSVHSWFAHLQHGDTWRLRQKILTPFAFML